MLVYDNTLFQFIEETKKIFVHQFLIYVDDIFSYIKQFSSQYLPTQLNVFNC